MSSLSILIDLVDKKLLPNLDIESLNPYDPIVVNNLPKPWKLLGVGNYAAGIVHPDFSEYVIKIYAPGRPGIEDEIEVYKKMGTHPSFSKCYHYTDKYLILKRFYGKTLYNCIKTGVQIPKSVIKDIDKALEYAKSIGLNPNDVHAKNVMIVDGKGVVVDISDFNKPKNCTLWRDFKKAYYKIYLPFFYKKHPPVPNLLLEIIRKSYRTFRRLFR